MDAFMNELIKMSLRGIVIILVVLLVRLWLKKLEIDHKYILGLWAMTFLYFIFPWKLSLADGFWSDAGISEEIEIISELRLAADERYEETGDTANSANPVGIVSNIIVDTPDAVPKDTIGTVDAIFVEQVGQNIAGMNETKFDIGRAIELIWLAGLSGFFGHMLYSYFALKRKLQLSVLFEDNIWWAENVDIPMVFGLIHPRIYLPISMESGDISYVIAHEKMHIKRKDGLFKMFAYVVCLIHWFNPLIWIAYFLFGSDMEKACDEEVIRSMAKEKRKEYAYALLHIAAESGSGKKRVFIAPICFGEGNIKSRIKNIMKYQYTFPLIGIIAVIVIAALSAMFMTETKSSDVEEDVKTEEAGEEPADVTVGEETEKLPVFYAEDLNALQIGENFSLEDYYITSRYTFSNHYYIDENKELWGTGKNEFGQLGTGTYGEEEYYEEPVKIAENVVSVDASWNGYFCIYLTDSGELYGVGLNHSEVLLGEGSESQVYSDYNFRKVTDPVLLMTDVAYARAGRECIVALQNNKTAYWWGQYAPWTHTFASSNYDKFWTLEEDASNPLKMLAIQPVKIMDDCRYITTGTFTGAAISESGELYTWGFNVFGQCGTLVTGDDFVRTPVKVMDNVKMVWPDRIAFSDSMSRFSEFVRWETDYLYNTFVLTGDNDLLAVGLDMGDKEKVTQVNGDLEETQTNRYSDDFLPIRAAEYSVENNMKILRKLEFGMSIEEVQKILNGADMRTFRVDESVYNEGYTVGLSAEYSQYHCYFDSQNKLVRIAIQEGGSRDGRFVLGMSFSDLEKAVEEAGGALTKIENDDSWEFWSYQDLDEQTRYEFSVYEGSITSVNEIGIGENLAAETNEKEKPVIMNEYQTKFQDEINTYEIKDGKLYGSGANTSGQLGTGEITSQDSYEQHVLIAENVIHMDACGETLIYLNDKNELYGVGNNGSGQLGQPIEEQDGRKYIAYVSDNGYKRCCVTEPVFIMDHVKYAVAGGGYIMVLQEDGTLYTMGDNLNGQLGNGTARPVVNEWYAKEGTVYSSEPVHVLDDIAFIAADDWTAAAISKKGDLWMWGDNSFGEIGNSRRGNGMPSVSTDVVSEPYLALKKVKEVYFEDWTVYAVNFEGQKYSWGKNAAAIPRPVEED